MACWLGMGQTSIQNENFKARDGYTTSISLYCDDGSLESSPFWLDSLCWGWGVYIILNQHLERNLTLHLHIYTISALVDSHFVTLKIYQNWAAEIYKISEVFSTHPMNYFCALKTRSLYNTTPEGFLNKNLIIFTKRSLEAFNYKSWSQQWLSTPLLALIHHFSVNWVTFC